jgi:hypothetical protein
MPSSLSKTLVFLITLVAFVQAAVVPRQAAACPMCKQALEATPIGDGIILASATTNPEPFAYFVSILFMLGMMTAVAGSVVYALYRINKAEQAALIPVPVKR